ncbi:hypothetical protein CAEBREN_06879 [Caenorhabditis brenneri]|uniref:F-box domain-containing protein n=1 Tax=Caenorhabditis brenneri TaxID=135651 RepID=G0NHI1_CAEBE|nr:hypothetical protein CAEBREN_06879 [Caenorhabditis brenneri]
MTSTFPLFKLPYVAIRRFLKVLGLKNIIFLSMSSRKTRAFLKSHRALFPESWIEVNYLTRGAVEIFANNDVFTFRIHTWSPVAYGPQVLMKIGDTNMVASISGGDQMYTYWKDEIQGISILLDYVTDLFNLPVSGLCLDSKNGTARDSLFRMIPSPTQDLILEYAKREESMFDLNWLMAVDTKFISLLNPRLTMKDLNRYLKRWMTGGSSNLRSLSIQMKFINQLAILSGLDGVQREKNVRRVWKNDYGNSLKIRGGYDIVRESDRKIATVAPHRNEFLMVVWD